MNPIDKRHIQRMLQATACDCTHTKLCVWCKATAHREEKKDDKTLPM